MPHFPTAHVDHFTGRPYGASAAAGYEPVRNITSTQGHESIDALIFASRGATCDGASESYVPLPPQATPRVRYQNPCPEAGMVASTSVLNPIMLSPRQAIGAIVKFP